MIKLSPYILPQIRQGLHAMVPVNMTHDDGRMLYVQSILAAVQEAIAKDDLAAAIELRNHSPLAQHYVLWDEDAETGQVSATTMPEIENGLGLRPEALGVLFRDGRLRDDGEMAYVPLGEDLPHFVTLLQRLHRGIPRADLLALAEELDVGLDAEVLDYLIQRGVIEEGAAPAPSTETGCGVAWMGHAYVRAVSGGKSVWFDPYPLPRMRWTPDEAAALFRSDTPDAFSLANYGPTAHHVTQDELPTPEAVFITHQDVDHVDLGALALLPASVPIYVPEAEADKPWQVDLVAALKTILGGDRNVVVLRHGETIDVGDMRVTALPFVGKFPATLPHKWNCYYLELPSQVWALFADSAVTPEQVRLCQARRQGDARPFGVMTSQVHAEDPHTPGYRDGPGLYSLGRLYSWYLPLAHQFSTALKGGLHVDQLRKLVEDCGATVLYPYSRGNLPWYRVAAGPLHEGQVGSHSLAAFDHFTELAKGVGARVVRLRHGELYTP